MQEIKSCSDFEKLMTHDLAIVDFHATWCGPCKFISPLFKKLSEEHSSPSIIFAKCDIDEANDVAEKCCVKSMPTFHIYQKGKKVDELIGANQEKLKEKIGHHVTNVAKSKESEIKAHAASINPASRVGSLRDVIDIDSSKLQGTSNLSSVRNIISPPPAGYAIASVTGSSELLVHLSFSTPVCVESVRITTMKDSIDSAPSRIQIGSNVPTLRTASANESESDSLQIESLDKAENLQSFTVFSDDYVDTTAVLRLKSSKFSRLSSLTIGIETNMSGISTLVTKIGAIDIIGSKV